MKRLILAAGIIMVLVFTGCQEPDNPAELKAAHEFCQTEESKVKSIQFMQFEGHGFRVECMNGAVAE